jgi:hypothetical protein
MRSIERKRQIGREVAARQRVKHANDPEWRAEQAAYIADWRKRNPDHNREYRAANKGRIAQQQRKRTLSAYDLTIEEFEAMLAAQGGVCAICAGPPGGRWNRLFVDHDHETGKVRGLLCHLCNAALERVDKYRTNIDLYLERVK